MQIKTATMANGGRAEKDGRGTMKFHNGDVYQGKFSKGKICMEGVRFNMPLETY
jgi:hypothetical protein